MSIEFLFTVRVFFFPSRISVYFLFLILFCSVAIYTRKDDRFEEKIVDIGIISCIAGWLLGHYAFVLIFALVNLSSLRCF